MFRGIHPRLSGIGTASILASFCIVAYYNIIIGWSLIYLVFGFFSPLPWSVQYTVDGKHKDCVGQFGTDKLFITTE